MKQEIPIENIKTGRNEIAIRCIGSGQISPITISSKGSEIELENKWRFKVSAEIYKQLVITLIPICPFIFTINLILPS